ncbi:MAG: LysE family translocator [Pseudomonadota bacterium]
MADLDTLAAFFVATMIFAYMPGPALLYATAQTIARGRKGGLMAAFGIHLGGYVHVIAAAAGLGFLLSQVPTAYMIVKLAGAAYLVWLGFRMITQRIETDSPQPAASNPRRTFAQSMLVEILNPKTAVFFIAFLPQFVDPAAALPAWLQFLILGTIVNVVFSSADLVAVALAHRIVGRIKQSLRGQRLARWIGGSILTGLGIRLGLEGSGR